MNKKDIIKIIIEVLAVIILFLVFFLVGKVRENAEFAEQYRINHYNRLQRMRGIVYDIEFYSDEELQLPRYLYYMEYPDTSYRVNLWDLNYYIYIYNLLIEDELNITAEEIIELYYKFDEEKDADFDKLYAWYYGENGVAKIQTINQASTQALLLYYQKYEEPYCGVDNIGYLSYEELINFIEWILANPDYEFAAEYDEYYQFLDWMGLIPESERREVPEKEEELYDAEIYVVE